MIVRLSGHHAQTATHHTTSLPPPQALLLDNLKWNAGSIPSEGVDVILTVKVCVCVCTRVLYRGLGNV